MLAASITTTTPLLLQIQHWHVCQHTLLLGPHRQLLLHYEQPAVHHSNRKRREKEAPQQWSVDERWLAAQSLS